MSRPPRHAHGDLTSLAPHERLPEILVVPREKTPTMDVSLSKLQEMVEDTGKPDMLQSVELERVRHISTKLFNK